MLNPFPIQFLALFAYFLLRVTVALVLFVLAWRHFKWRHELAAAFGTPWFPFSSISVWVLILTELIIALMLLVGFYTQYAALALLIVSFKFMMFRPLVAHPTIPPRLLYVLLFGAALSLFITGAGVFAFDLPI